jgi:hypothetical protein
MLPQIDSSSKFFFQFEVYRLIMGNHIGSYAQGKSPGFDKFVVRHIHLPEDNILPVSGNTVFLVSQTFGSFHE